MFIIIMVVNSCALYKIISDLTPAKLSICVQKYLYVFSTNKVYFRWKVWLVLCERDWTWEIVWKKVWKNTQNDHKKWKKLQYAQYTEGYTHTHTPLCTHTYYIFTLFIFEPRQNEIFQNINDIMNVSNKFKYV